MLGFWTVGWTKQAIKKNRMGLLELAKGILNYLYTYRFIHLLVKDAMA